MSCIICRVGGRSGMILNVGLLILAGLQGGLRPLTCDLVGPPSVGLEDHACNQVKARDSHVDGVQICPELVSSLPHCAPGADHLTASDVMAEAEILQVVPEGQDGSLHLLSIAGSPDVGAVVGVLAAAVEH